MVKKISMDMTVADLDLPTRAYNALYKSNINTVSDLVQATEAELLRTPNFGRKSLQGVEKELRRYGLKLGMTNISHRSPYNSLKIQFDRLEKRIDGLSDRITNNVANHEKLARLHNEVARAVINLEDRKPGGVMPPQIGVSLRDQFAMAALPAIIQNKGVQTTKLAAEVAYAMADAMLEARGSDK